MKKRILLVEPNFPYPNRSKNRANEIHKNFAPIGLLKLGAFHKSKRDKVKLIRGNADYNELGKFIPDEILITSIFTYWSKYVWDCISHYRNKFPRSIIKLGGIYATLHRNTPEFIKKMRKYNVRVYVGVQKNVEKFLPDYSLLQGEINHHITHAMRGCIRRCKFCGVWKIEPKIKYKKVNEIVSELKQAGKNKVIFFDNNFFANPFIKDILKSLEKLKINGGSITFESQSGFDGRILEKDPELALLLKKARFSNIRIAWDNSLNDKKSIKKQIKFLNKAGFPSKEIAVFMIYNFNIPYEIMLKKLNYCKKWGVQINDCRYRPLSSTFDNYKPHAFKGGQTKEEYYIHEESGWNDKKIRNFRKKVRQHNLEIRYARGEKYNKDMEKWSAIHNTYKFFKLGRPPRLENIRTNKKLQIRIRLLTKIKNYFIKNQTLSFSLKEIPEKNMDSEIKKIIQKIRN